MKKLMLLAFAVLSMNAQASTQEDAMLLEKFNCHYSDCTLKKFVTGLTEQNKDRLHFLLKDNITACERAMRIPGYPEAVMCVCLLGAAMVGLGIGGLYESTEVNSYLPMAELSSTLGIGVGSFVSAVGLLCAIDFLKSGGKRALEQAQEKLNAFEDAITECIQA